MALVSDQGSPGWVTVWSSVAERFGTGPLGRLVGGGPLMPGSMPCGLGVTIGLLAIFDLHSQLHSLPIFWPQGGPPSREILYGDGTLNCVRHSLRCDFVPNPVNEWIYRKIIFPESVDVVFHQ